MNNPQFVCSTSAGKIYFFELSSGLLKNRGQFPNPLKTYNVSYSPQSYSYAITSIDAKNDGTEVNNNYKFILIITDSECGRRWKFEFNKIRKIRYLYTIT